MRVVPCRATNIVLVESGRVILTHQRGHNRFFLSQSFFENVNELMRWDTYRTMYIEKEAVFIPDTGADEHWVKHKDTQNVRSYIGMPLIAGGQVVGFLNIDNDQPNGLKAEYLPQLKIFADYAAIAIENARLYTHITQRAEENAALLTTASAVSKSLDFMEVLRVIAEQMINVFQVSQCAIMDYDAQKQQVSILLRHFADGRVEIPQQGDTFSLDTHNLLREIINSGEPRLLHINDAILNNEDIRLMRQANIGSLALLPLILQEHVIGLVAISDEKDDHSFSVREITLGLSMASHAAAAIENARLYRQLQEHAIELENRVQRRTRQLQEITEYLEGILISVPEAVFVLNEDHQLVRTNPAGESIRKQAQETGLDLLDPELLQTLEGDSLPTMQSLIEVQGKSYQVVSSSLEGKNGRPGGKIVVFRDVTHFRELDQMKTQFVSDVSHELRTPLTNLTLYLDLLALANNPDRQAAYIQTLKRETGRLAHLIEDLLTISRLEAGRIQFQIRPVDINQIVANLVSDRIFLAAQKEIELKFSPAQTLPLAAVDENMLTQAISNLLTNATNYTQAGGSIFVSTARPSTGWLTIRVADTGVGIAPEESRRIFERFYRGNASQVTGAEGTGLGLAISQEIIQRMGGKITVNSVPGEGSTFTIWLPEFAENDK
jgi:signal transduction histidine kinase